MSFSVFRISVGDDKKIVLTANLFAKSSTIFYQQQCCLKTATIAGFFSKKRAVLRSYSVLFVGADDICADGVKATFDIAVAAVDLFDILDCAHSLGAHCGDKQ